MANGEDTAQYLRENGYTQASQPLDQLFVQEGYLHKARLAETDFRDELIEAIKAASLTLGCKQQLEVIVRGQFDKTSVLAWMDDSTDVEIAKLRLEQILNRAKVGYGNTDRNEPSLLTLNDMIIDHYEKFISRARQMKERSLQNVQQVESSQTLRQGLIGQPSQQKRGFRWPFG